MLSAWRPAIKAFATVLASIAKRRPHARHGALKNEPDGHLCSIGARFLPAISRSLCKCRLAYSSISTRISSRQYILTVASEAGIITAGIMRCHCAGGITIAACACQLACRRAARRRRLRSRIRLNRHGHAMVICRGRRRRALPARAPLRRPNSARANFLSGGVFIIRNQ